MLAYDENERLKEFEEEINLIVCKNCHHLYYHIWTEQIPGFREREFDCCPYCNNVNGSSMRYDFNNRKITIIDLMKLKKKNLFNKILMFCHKEFQNRICDNCNHINGCPSFCEGKCEACLEEIHFPNRFLDGKKDYDCYRMLQFYVCKYVPKYASEMLYLLRDSKVLKSIQQYNVVSIGCGACPDLMAFETYCHEEENFKSINYTGIDVNELWRPIHNEILNYRTTTINDTKFEYFDAVRDNYSVIENANVIVLQYLISHFYNTGLINEIDVFFDKLIDNIITHKQKGEPLVILINDVNSNNRGRDYFERIIVKLSERNFHGTLQQYYFDYNIQNNHQQYGKRHINNSLLYRISNDLDFYNPWKQCTSAQLLIEVYEDGI